MKKENIIDKFKEALKLAFNEELLVIKDYWSFYPTQKGIWILRTDYPFRKPRFYTWGYYKYLCERRKKYS